MRASKNVKFLNCTYLTSIFPVRLSYRSQTPAFDMDILHCSFGHQKRILNLSAEIGDRLSHTSSWTVPQRPVFRKSETACKLKDVLQRYMVWTLVEY